MADTINNIPLADIIEWDVKNWSQLINYWQPIVSTLPRDATVLAIGERNGGLSLWLASIGFNVLCTDINDITERAEQLHGLHGLAHKIKYDTLDIVNANWQPEQFDLIIAKSVIGGLKSVKGRGSTRSIEAQEKAMHNIFKLLKPGGYFLSAENLKGGWLVQLSRKVTNRGKGWRHPAYSELERLFTPFPVVQTKTFGILPTLFRSRVMNDISYFLNKYVLFFIPAKSRYIGFTVARK